MFFSSPKSAFTLGSWTWHSKPFGMTLLDRRRLGLGFAGTGSCDLGFSPPEEEIGREGALFLRFGDVLFRFLYIGPHFGFCIYVTCKTGLRGDVSDDLGEHRTKPITMNQSAEPMSIVGLDAEILLACCSLEKAFEGCEREFTAVEALADIGVRSNVCAIR